MLLRAVFALAVLVVSAPRIAASGPARAEVKAAPATTTSPNAPRLDPIAATQAYIAKLTPEQIAKSDSYFEGGYWLILWNFLVSAGLSLVLLTTGLSARMRNVAERVWPFVFGKSSLETISYGAQYFLFTMILSFPLTIYQGYFRERDYGLSDQPLGIKPSELPWAQCSAGSRSWSFMRFSAACRSPGGSGPRWPPWRCCLC
jgi:STE24 endopeptidase